MVSCQSGQKFSAFPHRVFDMDFKLPSLNGLQRSRSDEDAMQKDTENHHHSRISMSLIMSRCGRVQGKKTSMPIDLTLSKHSVNFMLYALPYFVLLL